jgi:hypothetical protein
MTNITHVVIESGYGSSINNQIDAICKKITDISGEYVTCLFTYDSRIKSRPMFVPNATPKKTNHAQEVFDAISGAKMNGPVCFEMKSVMYMFFVQLAILQCDAIGIAYASRNPHAIHVFRATENSEGVLVISYGASEGTELE